MQQEEYLRDNWARKGIQEESVNNFQLVEGKELF